MIELELGDQGIVCLSTQSAASQLSVARTLTDPPATKLCIAAI